MNKMVSIKPGSSPEYERDGYGWAMAQAALIRAGRFDDVDWENVVEEVESVGKSEKNACQSQLIRILVHMLKWEAQPERLGRSWWHSIMDGRRQAKRILKDNPGLKPILPDLFATSLEYAREDAALETGLSETVFEAIVISQEDAFNHPYDRPEGD